MAIIIITFLACVRNSRAFSSITPLHHHRHRSIKTIQHNVVWEFSRPHTLIGTVVSIPAIYFFAAPSPMLVFRSITMRSILYTLVCSGLANLFITGLNQITDVEIDRVNKPTLPIASGRLSVKDASRIIVVSLLLSYGMAFMSGSAYLLGTVICSTVFGTLYSLSPFRWKCHPLLAAFCIVMVRGLVVNIGFYGHAMTTVYGNTMFSIFKDAKCLLLASYFSIFALIIALCKDIPDVRGDEKYGVRSLSVRMGESKMFSFVHRLVNALFTTVVVGVIGSVMIDFRVLRLLVALVAYQSHLKVQQRASIVQPTNHKDVYSYYMFLWKLFYLSYMVLPLVRL